MIVKTEKYNICIESGLLGRIPYIGGKKAVIVTDDIVNSLYGDITERSFQAAGYSATRFVFPHGERSKNIGIYTELLETLSRAELTRTDVVAGLGGGVVGDMAGFAAATYLRGVRFMQIPTTLLAMVDSSVGGKTAVNLSSGKNQAGTFYQPHIVICDYDTLCTLPETIYRDGCAEIIKHAVIRDKELFRLLKQPDSLKTPQLADTIARNVSIKRDIVALDERDTGIRQLLNFGHTIGHAVEKLSGYTISHGSAVAIGMAIESRGFDCHGDIIEMLKRYNLPYETGFTSEQLINAAFSDKKRSGENITIIIPEAIGACRLQTVTMEEFRLMMSWI